MVSFAIRMHVSRQHSRAVSRGCTAMSVAIVATPPSDPGSAATFRHHAIDAELLQEAADLSTLVDQILAQANGARNGVTDTTETRSATPGPAYGTLWVFFKRGEPLALAAGIRFLTVFPWPNILGPLI